MMAMIAPAPAPVPASEQGRWQMQASSPCSRRSVPPFAGSRAGLQSGRAESGEKARPRSSDWLPGGRLPRAPRNWPGARRRCLDAAKNSCMDARRALEDQIDVFVDLLACCLDPAALEASPAGQTVVVVVGHDPLRRKTRRELALSTLDLLSSNSLHQRPPHLLDCLSFSTTTPLASPAAVAL